MLLYIQPRFDAGTHSFTYIYICLSSEMVLGISVMVGVLMSDCQTGTTTVARTRAHGLIGYKYFRYETNSLVPKYWVKLPDKNLD